MSRNRETSRIVRALLDANPQVSVVYGTKHIKIMTRGKIITIMPYCLAREGLATNTRTQLRRAGVRVP